MADRFTDRIGSSAGLDPILEVWYRRKWLAIVVFIAVLSGGVTFVLSLPDLYRATTTVLVETQYVAEEFVRPSAINRPSIPTDLGTRIETIRQEVMSRRRLGDLIERLDLYPDLKRKGMALDSIIERMRRDVELDLKGVDQQTGGRSPTIAFAISYTGRNPQIVARVANVLASTYVEENTKIREGQAVRTAEFLRTQLADVKKELIERERRARDFNLSHIGELPQQVQATLATIERLNTQLRLNGDHQARAMDRRERIDKQLADSSLLPPPTSGPPSAVEQAARLRQQLDELRRKFTDRYPDVVRLEGELADLERQLAQSGKQGNGSATLRGPAAPVDPKTRMLQAIEDVDAELRVLKTEELALRQAVSGYEQRIENVPKRQEEFEALSRDSEIIKERHDTLLKRYEEAQLAASLEQGQTAERFRILDTANPPREPSAPLRVRLLAIVLVGAITLGVGAILVREKLDTTFHSVEDLRAFVSIPTLFSIPLIPTAVETRRKWRRVALATVSVAICLALIILSSRYLAVGKA